MKYSVQISKRAAKDLGCLDENIRLKIIESLEILSLNPFAEILNFKKLKGRQRLYRIRIGNYRVVYEVFGETLIIIVIRLGHRKDVYRFLKRT